MGGWISYNGENIAHYSPIVGRKNPSQPNEQVTRYNFSFKSLEDLITLLNAALRDIIEVDDEEMPYVLFREEMLRNAHRIYINPDCELFDQYG